MIIIVIIYLFIYLFIYFITMNLPSEHTIRPNQ